MARERPAALVRELESALQRFDPQTAARKVALLDELARARLTSAKLVARLHECACFLRAYPDDARVLAAAERVLAGFAKRPDLKRFRAELADSGIAGTDLYYPFFAPTARWLVERFGARVSVDWSWYGRGELLEKRLALLATYSETPGLDEHDMGLRKWVARLKGPSESDAQFLVRRLARMGRDEFEREALYDELGLTLKLAGVPETPSRTNAVLVGRPVHFQTTALRRERPDLRRAILTPPRAIRSVSEREGAAVVQLAREAMVSRSRDLDAFIHGDPRDVRLVDCGDGLEFACIGVKPERRLMLEAVYAYLTLKSGVPIGYVLTSALMGSSEIAYNVFDTWRGGEAAHIYGRVLATTRALFGSDTFTIYPYQLGGDGNTEGLKSGAWWFYQKLGFRSRDAKVLELMERELATQRRDPKHRSSIATLRELAKPNVFFSLGRARDDVIGVYPLADVGLAITDYLARRFGSERELGIATCADEAARLCGVRAWKRWPASERLAWERWSPLIAILPGAAKWPRPALRDLAAVVRAKGALRESDFVRAFDAHRQLRAALRRLVARH